MPFNSINFFKLIFTSDFGSSIFSSEDTSYIGFFNSMVLILFKLEFIFVIFFLELVFILLILLLNFFSFLIFLYSFAAALISTALYHLIKYLKKIFLYLIIFLKEKRISLALFTLLLLWTEVITLSSSSGALSSISSRSPP